MYRSVSSFTVCKPLAMCVCVCTKCIWWFLRLYILFLLFSLVLHSFFVAWGNGNTNTNTEWLNGVSVWVVNIRKTLWNPAGLTRSISIPTYIYEENPLECVRIRCVVFEARPIEPLASSLQYIDTHNSLTYSHWLGTYVNAATAAPPTK